MQTILVLAVGFFLAAAGDLNAQDQVQGQLLRVWAQRANVRDMPSTNGKVIFQLPQGELLRVIRKEDDWYFIEVSGDRKGYISALVVQPIEAPKPAPRVPESASSPFRSSPFEAVRSNVASGGSGNDDIIAMARVGLSDGIILVALEKIDSAKFDLTPAGLIALKNGGVSEAVIRAVIEKGGSSGAATPSRSASETSPPSDEPKQNEQPAAQATAKPPQTPPSQAQPGNANSPGPFGLGVSVAAVVRPRVWYDVTDRVTVSGMMGYERFVERFAHVSAFWLVPELLYRFPQPGTEVLDWEPYLGGGMMFGQVRSSLDFGVFGGLSESTISFNAFLGSGGVLFSFNRIPKWRFSGEVTIVNAGVGDGSNRLVISTTGFRLGGHYRF